MKKEHDLELAVGRVLRFGILASTVCLAFGLVLKLAGVTPLASARLLTIGVVLLLATPAGRVVVSVVDYALDRDWTFVTLTVIVLLELVASVLAAVYGFSL